LIELKHVYTIDNGRQCSKNSPAYSFRAVQVLAIAPINYMTFLISLRECDKAAGWWRTAVASLSDNYMPMCSQRVWSSTRSQLIASLQINHKKVSNQRSFT